MKQKYLEFLLGKKKFQYFFEKLHKLSLMGMNCGTGSDFSKCGELFAAQYIKNKLKNEKSFIIFDVGHYCTELSKIFSEKETNIYAFEPSKTTYEQLISNTSCIKSISPNNIGFSDKEETLALYTTNCSSTLSSVYKRNLDHVGIMLDQIEQISLQTIDKFCEMHMIDRIHLLKLDIEGNELKAINGAKRMIENNKIDFIQFEFGGTNIDARTYFKDFWLLLKDKYNFYRIVKDGLQPIVKYKEIYEIFTTTNYLLEHKL